MMAVAPRKVVMACRRSCGSRTALSASHARMTGESVDWSDGPVCRFLRMVAEPDSGSMARLLEIRAKIPSRSEEHTSELQSLMRTSYAVFCLKKKKKQNT